MDGKVREIKASAGVEMSIDNTKWKLNIPSYRLYTVLLEERIIIKYR